MPQITLKSWYAKPLPLPLRCSNLLGEIQQLLDGSQHRFTAIYGRMRRRRGLSAVEVAMPRSRKQLPRLALSRGMGANMSPLAKIAISLLLPLFLSGGVVGRWAGTWGWLRMKPTAHHHAGTSNSSCWWWDQGCLPSMGLTLAFVVQSYLLAASWCSFTLVAMGSSPTTHRVSQPSLARTSQTSHSNLHDFLAYQEALHHQSSLPSRVHMEGRDGSDVYKEKEVIFPFCFNGIFLLLLPDGYGWYLTEMHEGVRPR